MRRITLPLLLWLLVGIPSIPRAQEVATEAPAEETAEQATEAATPAAIEGPLFHVTTGDDPTPDPAAAERADVVDIYIESEDPFLAVFWWWVVGIAGLAGIGALLWWIWGRRQPRRASRL